MWAAGVYIEYLGSYVALCVLAMCIVFLVNVLLHAVHIRLMVTYYTLITGHFKLSHS